MTAEIDSRDEVFPKTSPPGPVGPAAESTDLRPMADRWVRPYMSSCSRRCVTVPVRSLASLILSTTAILAINIVEPPHAVADTVAYLVNVTVRPGYNFANADDALAYGYGICDHIAAGRAYGDVIADVKADFGTSDGYQASYLTTQAVNELCPAQIWQLRRSAAHYRPAVP